jgi:hypothetical protein
VNGSGERGGGGGREREQNEKREEREERERGGRRSYASVQVWTSRAACSSAISGHATLDG